jgi:hypothetical protein
MNLLLKPTSRTRNHAMNLLLKNQPSRKCNHVITHHDSVTHINGCMVLQTRATRSLPVRRLKFVPPLLQHVRVPQTRVPSDNSIAVGNTTTTTTTTTTTNNNNNNTAIKLLPAQEYLPVRKVYWNTGSDCPLSGFLEDAT